MNITREVKAGELFQARITRIMNFGAFAEVLPNQEGLIHISELADHRVENVEDVVHVGDIVPVIVKEIDSQGRINLSHKQAIRMASLGESKV
jgi:polyribonucleotide nucleotidyltransferase